MNGTKLFAEAMGFVKSGRGAFCRKEKSENVGLSNENIGENPMPRKPKGSLRKVRPRGVSQDLRRG
eukprot:scaffold8096_cov1613-Prasinococcus_capsulatus_cf.AAC.21